MFLLINFLPCFLLGQGSVFEIHDQMDETMLTYVLSGKHLFDGAGGFPELLGGIGASSMQPSAVLFIPIYRYFPAFSAFMVQYMTVCSLAWFGMYSCVRKLTESSILAAVTAVCFCLLPMQPVYGLSAWGVPLFMYAYLCLKECDEKHRLRGVWFPFVLILVFGLTTHLVLIGYVVLGFFGLFLLAGWCGRKKTLYRTGGFLLLFGTYVAVNHRLFTELLLGQSSYVSHREELVNQGYPVWENIRDVFINSSQHAVSLHRYLILPIVVLLIVTALCYRKLELKNRQRFLMALMIFGVLAGIAVLFGLFRSPAVAAWKNGQSGFFRYFQAERFYWLYPSLWLVEFALLAGIWWSRIKRGYGMAVKVLVLVLVLLPTLQLIKPHSYFYQNLNQYNNGSGVTGYVTWEAYYAEELMGQLETAIGRDMSEYRVAHLGISPAPSLMHGFYTVDGYSNNYPLEYKHAFRRVIAGELEKNEGARVYFDQWGSRCYLFNATSGTYWEISKGQQVQYEQLDFDMQALAELGCEYIFSGGEILCAQDLGLELMGYYETPESYWGVWLYRMDTAA